MRGSSWPLLLLAACTSATAPPQSEPTPTTVSVHPAHRCRADGECTTTCEYGAVNQAWFAAQQPTECGGGCTNPGAEAPRCEAGRCVAYRGGTPQPSCTEQSVAHARPASP